jgi:hypothetical protein
MRHVFIGMAVFFFASTVHSQPPPSDADATTLLHKVIDATDLRASSVPPFHLLASLHFESDGTGTDGKYEILWGAPDRYRVNFVLGDIGETDIVLGDKIFISRSTPILTFQKWLIERFLWSPGFQLENRTATRVSSTQVDGMVQTCMDAGSDKYARRQVCLDPATNNLMSATVGANPVKGNGKFQLELSDFVSLGTLRYPKHIRLQNNIWSTTVQVEKLTEAVEFDPNVFIPQANAISRDWCPDPDSKHQAPISAPSKSSAPHPFPETNGYSAWYILVGTDGLVKKSVLLHSSSSTMARSIGGSIGGSIAGAWHLIHSCRGKPIEYETVLWTADFVKQ